MHARMMSEGIGS